MKDSKKATKNQNSQIKYCSDRCRSRKPGPIDRKIERTIVSLLSADDDSGLEKTAAASRVVKGDPRIIVTCDEIEKIVFGSRFDPEKVFGRRKNRKSRAIGGQGGEWKSVDMEGAGGPTTSADSEENHTEHSSSDSVASIPSSDGGVRIRPSQQQSEVNFSVGGERGRCEKIEETAEDLEKRRQGAKQAEEREMVRRAARRGIVFGFEVPKREPMEQRSIKPRLKMKREVQHLQVDSQRALTEVRKAEALMHGTVVEPSFAKGNWSIRWRE